MTKLATGERINRAADDPSGMISSEQLRAVLAELEAETNSLQRVSAVASTADAALAEVSELQSESAAIEVALANDAGYSDAERDALRASVASNDQAIERIATTTTFNGQAVFDGSVELSVGESSVAIGDIRGLDAGAVNELRGRLGAFQKDTVEPRINAIGVAMENVAAAESIVRDTDYASETAEHSRVQALSLTAMAALGMVGDQHREAVLGMFG